jgi:hypothetical protein
VIGCWQLGADFRWINQSPHRRHAISGQADPAGMLANHILVRCQIDALQLVFSHEAVKPLNLRTHIRERLQGTQRQLANLWFGQTAGPRDFAFNHKLRHNG